VRGRRYLGAAADGRLRKNDDGVWGGSIRITSLWMIELKVKLQPSRLSGELSKNETGTEQKTPKTKGKQREEGARY